MAKTPEQLVAQPLTEWNIGLPETQARDPIVVEDLFRIHSGEIPLSEFRPKAVDLRAFRHFHKPLMDRAVEAKRAPRAEVFFEMLLAQNQRVTVYDRSIDRLAVVHAEAVQPGLEVMDGLLKLDMRFDGEFYPITIGHFYTGYMGEEPDLSAYRHSTDEEVMFATRTMINASRLI